MFDGEGEGERRGKQLFFAANERAEETPTNYDVGPSVGNPQPNIYSLYCIWPEPGTKRGGHAEILYFARYISTIWP